MYETTARDEVLVNYCSKQPNDMIDAKLLSNCLRVLYDQSRMYFTCQYEPLL
jgi:hypothetical protein